MAAKDSAPTSMREVVQQRFLVEMINCTPAWKVMVLDQVGTRIISAALTMYDIMEQRVTTVEQLAMSRAPFPEMDALYFCAPTLESVRKIADDFPNGKPPKYGAVHLFFTDSITDELMEVMQNTPNLLSRVKTLKELNLEFIAAESNAYHLDLKNCLPLVMGAEGDSHEAFKRNVARKLTTVCISLNEFPCIRYQASSRISRDVAGIVIENLKAYRKANPKGTFNGDDAQGERERASLLLVDRTFDALSPLMHEYSYQAMIYDLLNIEGDNIVSYMTTNNENKTVEKKALLGENDPLWIELRHSHIARVIDNVKKRMDDIIQNNSGAALQKKGGADMDITKMAEAVKQLPEYTQTMSKLSQHVAVAQQCMDELKKHKIMELANCEQTMSTGADEEGSEVRGPKLAQHVIDTLRTVKNPGLKKRLLGVYIAAQRGVVDDALMDAAGVTASDNFHRKLARMLKPVAPSPMAAAKAGGGGLMSALGFGRGDKPAGAASAATEGDYQDTRHVGLLKGLLEQMITGELDKDKFPAVGPSISSSAQAQENAKSQRKTNTKNERWARKGKSVSGSRCMCFVLGGLTYSEMRAGAELQATHSKEVVVGGTSFLSPDEYMADVKSLSS